MNRLLVMALVAVIVGLVAGLLVVESGNDDQPPVTLQEPNTVLRTVTTPSPAATEPTQTQPSTTPDGGPPPDEDQGSGGVEAP
jgi:hypothetical protein